MPSVWKKTKYVGVYTSATAARCIYSAREFSNGRAVSVQRAESFPLRDKYRLVASDGSSRTVDAVTYARARKAFHDAERTAGRVHDREAEDMTLREFYERWYSRPSSSTGQPRRPSTQARVEVVWRLYIQPAFGEVPVRAITHSMVLDWFARMTARQGSKNKALRTLSTLMRCAEAEGLRQGNPCRGIRTTDNVRAISRDQVLSAEQVEALKAALDPRYRLMIDLLTRGMRMGEVIGLRRNAVSLKGDVTIRSQVVEVKGHNVEGPPKSRNGYRVLPLADLATVLQQHIGRYSEATPDGYVFTARDGSAPLFAGTWRKRAFDPAVKRAGLPRITPHTLRHSAACMLADEGFSTLQVARWLGDTSATVERVYVNVLMNSNEKAAQVFAREEVTV